MFNNLLEYQEVGVDSATCIAIKYNSVFFYFKFHSECNLLYFLVLLCFTNSLNEDSHHDHLQLSFQFDWTTY